MKHILDQPVFLEDSEFFVRIDAVEPVYKRHSFVEPYVENGFHIKDGMQKCYEKEEDGNYALVMVVVGAGLTKGKKLYSTYLHAFIEVDGKWEYFSPDQENCKDNYYGIKELGWA